MKRLVLVLVLVVAAVATGVVVRYLTADSRREYLGTDGWPAHGQGAYQLGSERPHASADEQPVPIASLAKVMTAYQVLQAAPLATGADGPTLVVTAHDARDTARRWARDESVVSVRVGERLTERDALMALLLPSANNVAVLLARRFGGSIHAFVADMNRTAALLGMHDTTYTDPSGYAADTVSTARDQLTLALVVARDPQLAAMMATTSYQLPIVGKIRNTDILLGHDGFVGMKTGSDDDAGGCFMFRSRRNAGGEVVDLIGVVLGQRGRNLIVTGQYAARQLADRVAPDAAA